MARLLEKTGVRKGASRASFTLRTEGGRSDAGRDGFVKSPSGDGDGDGDGERSDARRMDS